ncbi:MAG: GNAT family N-acetyltransferase [Lachnospiraceae bacterium]|nr:GNAT family N-acetyltransferase [Lachnospiraceae bacterium]
MEIRKDIKNYSEEIIRIAYEHYKREISSMERMSIQPSEIFKKYLNDKLHEINGLVYLENGACRGYLLYNNWQESTELYCRIPEWGYGAESEKREKIISYLFQALAEEFVGEKPVNFSVNLYAHDVEMQRLFSFMEFGMQAETGIYLLKETVDASTDKIKVLEKAELENRWDEVWSLLSQLVNHLKKSPVFYPGEEFTEEVYKEFFADEGTRVYIAEDESKIIGLIASNPDELLPVFATGESANVGEVFVLPEYRGQKIAEALLAYVKKDLLKSNYRYAWVEHGTANPNARYFWNKYFSTYKYEMIRRIQ